ncbi:MAG: LuxR C-terminal-related transcriptional regulator [Anaerolineae bacterium]
MPETPTKSISAKTPVRLLRTKFFVPRAHPELVHRPALLTRLDESEHYGLTLVSAPAGFGKTTLLAAWIARRAPRIAWVSLDERDNDPSRFWVYVIGALQTVWDGIGARAMAMLQAPQSPPIEGILTELLNEIAEEDRPAILVLDDYHAISAQEIHQGLTFLLDNLPPQLSLIVSTRSDPPLSLALRRARRQLLELGPEDLRFSPGEAEALFNEVMGLGLETKDVATLEALTEGWVAGLQLAALSLQEVQDVARFMASFSGSHRYVFDYLAQEILNHQPRGIRDFLLRSAVLERMTASLCNAVTRCGDSQARLEWLEQANLFLVPLDRERRWYRYHHLFLEFLRAQLAKELAEDQIAELHRRASGWYSVHDALSEAIDHALLAGAYTTASDLIKQTLKDAFHRSELRTLLSWIERLPEELVGQDATLSMATAWALVASRYSEGAEAYLQRVERLVGAVADGSPETLTLPPEARGVLAEVSCIRGTLSFVQMDLEQTKAYAHQVRTYLGEDVHVGAFNDRLALQGVAAFNLAMAQQYGGETQAALRTFTEATDLLQEDENLHLLPMSMSQLAELQMLQANLREAAHTYQEARRQAESLGPVSPLSGVAYTGLGRLLYEWNDLEQARDHLARGIEIGTTWFNWEILLNGYVGLAEVALALNQPEQAHSKLDALMGHVRRANLEWAVPVVDAYRALLGVRTGDLSSAASWAASFAIPEKGDIPYLLEAQALILSRVRLAQGDPACAVRLTSRIIASATADARFGRVIEALVVQALALDAHGRREDALSSLSSALARAEPEGYVRTFVDHGEPMRRLLQALEGSTDYVMRLLTVFEAASPAAIEMPAASPAPPRGELIESLTDREVEVLGLMAEGLTNQEIADRLYISINTVKTHAKRIYDKLDVRNRAQATVVATELRLL